MRTLAITWMNNDAKEWKRGAPPILTGQQDFGHINHPDRLARIMNHLDRGRDLDYVRPDGAFRNLDRMVDLQVCRPSIVRLLHRRGLWFEMCFIQCLCVRMVRIYDY